MATSHDDAQQPLVPRVFAPNSGFFVKQSEDTIKKLEAENFNLKLKIYHLKLKQGIPASEGDQFGDYADLCRDNEAMHDELQEKQDLLLSALYAIETLEEQKLSFELKCQKMIQQQKRFDKAKTRKFWSKKSKMKFAPAVDEGFRKDADSLRCENQKLMMTITALQKEVADNKNEIEAINDAKMKLENTLDVNESKLLQSEEKITKLSEKLKNENPSNTAAYQKENDQLKSKIAQLTTKCNKLLIESEDLQRLVSEQAGLMKALNRTIEVKNEELSDYKHRLDTCQVSSSMSDLYIPEDISLCENGVSHCSSASSEYPFYNPLFGKEFESKYR